MLVEKARVSAKEPVTIGQLASASRLSIATVSKILGGSYKGNTDKGRRNAVRVRALADRLGYRPNAAARRLRGGAHRAIMALVPTDPHGHPDGITSEYLSGLGETLAQAGYLLSPRLYQRHDFAAAIAALGERNADGAVILESSSAGLDAALREAGLPCVHLNTEPGPGRTILTRDEAAAGRDLATALAGLGYRRLIGIGCGAGEQHPAIAARIDSLRTVLPLELVDRPAWWSNYAEIIATVRPAPGTAVVALFANACLGALRALGPTVPLACCDDAHVFTQVMDWLTRVRFDRTDLGRRAARLLLDHALAGRRIPAQVPVRMPVMVGTSTPAVSPA